MEEMHKSFGNLASLFGNDFGIYREALKKITEARDIKVMQNLKIVSDTEAAVVKKIKEARFKMTGI